METDLQKYRCGACGDDKYHIYRNSKGELITECMGCESTTLVTLTEPKITLEWHGDSNGMMCIFKGD